MTNQEHNKYLAVSFLVHGCIHVMVSLFFGVIMLMFFAVIPERATVDGPPFAIFGFIMAFVLFIQLAQALPSFIAGYSIWKRKSWAKPAGIVGAVLAAMNFPIGTAVCVYAFWFLLGEGGKEIYPSKQQSLPQSNFTASHYDERQYNQPPQPPNLWD